VARPSQLSVALALMLQFLSARMSYRLDFVSSLLSAVAASVTGFLFLFFLLDGSGISALGGWNKYEVLFIFGLSYLSTSLFSIVSPNLYQFGDRYVIQGQFDRVLLRPMNSLLQVLSETFNFESFGNFAVGLAAIEISRRELGLDFGILQWAMLVFFAISGAIILVSIFVIVASLSFHFEDKLGIAPPFYNLMNFGRYPLTIFDSSLRFFLSWIVPFGFVAFYPASFFFEGKDSLSLLTPLVAAVFFTLALFAWRAGEKAYASTGN